MTKENRKFKSYSKNLTNFLNQHGLKANKTGVHYWGVRISTNDGATWSEYTSIEEALVDFGFHFSHEKLESLRDESLKTDNSVSDGQGFLVRKRIRFYSEFDYNEELTSLLQAWKETAPKKT